MKAPALNNLNNDDDGYATVVAIALCLVLLTLGGAVLAVGDVVLTRQQAGAAADLAALSATSRLLAGAGAAEACASADTVAAMSGAELMGCATDGEDVSLEVRRWPSESLRPMLSAAGSPDGAVHAFARAGPPP